MAASESDEGVCANILRYDRASLVLRSSTVDQMVRCAECIKPFRRTKMQSFIRKGSGQPIQISAGRQLQAFGLELANLDKKTHTQRISGRQACVKDLVSAGPGLAPIGPIDTQRVFAIGIRRHGEDWTYLDSKARRHFEAMACEEGQFEEEATAGKRAEVTADLFSPAAHGRVGRLIAGVAHDQRPLGAGWQEEVR